MKKCSKYILRFKDPNNAVSEVVGAILLLGIVISLFSVIYFVVLAYPFGTSPPTPVIIATVEGKNIVIEHRGGDELGLDTEIQIDTGTGLVDRTVGELLVDSNGDGHWNIGEKLIYPFGYNLSRTEADVTTVDIAGNRLLLTGNLDIHPECDLGVKITVDNKNPTIFHPVNITITVTNYRGDLSNATGIQVKYILPTGLTYRYYTSSQGSYVNSTGIWDVGKLGIRGSATLTISAKVVAIGHSAPTQLVCILDGSTSITDQNWSTFTHGLADAIKSSSFPHDGSVELTIIQFGGDKSSSTNAKIEVGPIIVTESNNQSIANSIWNSGPIIKQYTKYSSSYTPLSCGIRRANDFLISSTNYHDFKHVICLITDGNPNCKGYLYPVGDSRRYKIDTYGTSDSDYSRGRTDAEDARKEAKNNVLIPKDELDVLAINSGGQYGGPPFPNLVNWLKTNITWPGNYQWPEDQEVPLGPGWVRVVNGWNEFPSAIEKMFNVLFNGISNTVEIVHSTQDDPNMDNNQATLPTIMPHS